jgi:hypothetical protein
LSSDVLEGIDYLAAKAKASRSAYIEAVLRQYLRDRKCLASVEIDESNSTDSLELLEELTRRARNINPAGDVAFAIFHPLHNARGLAALGAIRALGSVHDLLTVSCFCDLGAYCHVGSLPI